MIAALCVLLSAVMAATPTPADQLSIRMILTEIAQDGEMRISETQTDPGQCRRFQVNSFAEVSQRYMLATFPDAELYLPAEHSDPQVSGRPIGSCWDMPDPSTGNAFMEVARYDYDRSLSDRENHTAAEAFLTQVRAGDLLQLLATYSNGVRGTHTLMFTQPYDPRSEALYWVDSNFANRRIDGVRYGIVKGYQTWPISDLAGWIAADQGNGATLYRLSEDIDSRVPR